MGRLLRGAVREVAICATGSMCALSLFYGPACAAAADGAAVFAAHCAVCHGAEANGVPGTFPSLHEQIASFAKSPAGRDYLVLVVSAGLMGQLTVGKERFNNVMPAQSGLSELEVAAVLSHLSGVSISAAEVRSARSRHPELSAQDTRLLRPTTDSTP